MKKFLCILLVVLMLCVPLASCSDNPDDSQDTGTKPADTQATDTQAPTEEVVELPDDKFEGYEFNMLTAIVVTYNYTMVDFDEPSDDAYENALYNRALKVEEQFDITINEVTSDLGGNVYNLFKTAVDANTGDYDITFNNMTSSCQATGAGYCYNLQEFEYIDLDKSWWNDDCTQQLALGGNYYMAAGDIALSDKECLWAMYFIKQLIEDNKFESPYDLVASNQWTWDKMYAMACQATADENGSGALDSGDVYGLCTHGENYPASWEAADQTLFALDSDGLPVDTWGTEQFVNVFEDIVEIMGDSEHVSASDIALITTNLKEGKTLFGTEVIAFVRDYRENEYDFGILPYPKYNSDIDRYNTYVAVNACCMTIGNDCHDTYQTGAITEALAYYGQKEIMPVYYEGQLKSRNARDEESSAMLDIIFKQRCYDLGVFFGWGGVYSSLTSATANPTNLHAQTQKQVNKQISKSLEKLGIG